MIAKNIANRIGDVARKYRNNSVIAYCYRISPLFIQNLIYTCFGFFKYREYKKLEPLLVDYEIEESLSIEQIQTSQLEKLKQLLIHASINSVYYSALFLRHNFEPRDMKTIDELKRIPILDKNTFIDNYDLIMARNYEEFSPIEMSSGGTTGTTLKFLMDEKTYIRKELQVLHYWKRFGYELGKDKTIMYRAGVLIPKGAKIVKPWRFDFARKMLYLSSYYGGDAFYAEYYSLLKRWKPKYMHFLPSAVYLFAKYLNNNNLKIDLNLAFSASEMLLETQKMEIEKAFNCNIVDHYGHIEPGNYVAGQCKNGNYHVCTTDVITEVLDDGSLIETSLINHSMPFIRYKVGDLVDGLHSGCGCGINTPYFEKIFGRESSLVYTSDGRIISTIGFDQIFRGNNIRLGQIIQKQKGELILKLVVEDGFAIRDELKILKSLQDRVGESTRISLEYVDDIPKAKSGKYNLFISELS
jgi:phenylacetate-CoA ligase